MGIDSKGTGDGVVGHAIIGHRGGVERRRARPRWDELDFGGGFASVGDQPSGHELDQPNVHPDVVIASKRGSSRAWAQCPAAVGVRVVTGRARGV